MEPQHTSKFASPELNAKLLSRLRVEKLDHSVDRDGTIGYAAADEERIENDTLGDLRGQVFPSWQLVFCPPDWAARYERYMARHKVPAEAQWVDGQPCFLIPRQYRPHTWKLPDERAATVPLCGVDT